MRIRAFLSGVLVAVLVASACFTTPVGAQQIMRIYGTFSGAPIALLATSGGVLRVSLDGGAFSGQLLAPATPTDCSVPGFSFQGDTDNGLGYASTNEWMLCAAGQQVMNVAGNRLWQRNASTAQVLHVATTYSSSTNNSGIVLDAGQTQSGVSLIGTRTATTGTGQTALFAAQITNGSNTYAGMAANRQSQASWGGTATSAFVGLGLMALDTTSAVTTGANGAIVSLGFGTRVDTSGTNYGVAILPTYNQSGSTSTNTDLLVNRTQTAVGSGQQNLLDLQVANSSLFRVSSGGNVVMSGGNFFLGAGYLNLLSTTSTTAGDASSSATKMRAITGIADNTATDVFTVTVPNAAHSATIRVMFNTSLGAGGAIGANEATGNIAYDIAVARTAGVATVATLSAAYGASSSSVAGAATITSTGTLSGMTGAVGATQTFTIRITIARGSGASTNHTCWATAEIVNANATGITIS